MMTDHGSVLEDLTAALDDLTEPEQGWAGRLLDNLPPPQTRRQFRAVWGVYAAFLVAAVFAVLAVAAWADARHQEALARRAVAANHVAAQRLAQQVVGLGGTPVVQPSNLPAAGGKAGPTGPAGQGLTLSDAVTAMTIFCGAHNGCQGGPTVAQVDAALRGLCASSGLCKGTDGKDASDAQINAAMNSYCSTHTCVGPAGASGAPGAAGASGGPGQSGASGSNGRSVDSIDCIAVNPGQQLVIHYSDGTTQTVDCTPPGGTPS